jgi:hypothetical protein
LKVIAKHSEGFAVLGIKDFHHSRVFHQLRINNNTDSTKRIFVARAQEEHDEGGAQSINEVADGLKHIFGIKNLIEGIQLVFD